jgi:hypothetical protein
MKQWNELEIFQHIDLHDSFIIGWKCTDDTFFIDMEASLWPGHDAYEVPNEGEYTCYKKARLLFRNPINIVGLLAQYEVEPNKVTEGEIPDYDTIENFEIGTSEFRLSGKFGNVTLGASEWAFKVAYMLVPSKGD